MGVKKNLLTSIPLGIPITTKLLMNLGINQGNISFYKKYEYIGHRQVNKKG